MALAHYKRIADATDLPLIAFQYPLAGGQGYPKDTLLKLVEEVPSIRAIKDWIGNVPHHEWHIRTLQNLPRPVNVLTTHSAWLFSSLVLGCNGLLSGSGSVISDLQARLFRAVQANDLAEAKALNDRIEPLMRVFYADPFVDMHNRMKEALVLLGKLPRAVVRPPLVKIERAEIAAYSRRAGPIRPARQERGARRGVARIHERRHSTLLFPMNKFPRWPVIVLAVLYAVPLFAEFIANSQPIAVKYAGKYYFPIFWTYRDVTFGGDFNVAADYRDPYLQQMIEKKGGTIIWPPIRYSYDTVNLNLPTPAPSMPTWMLTESECQPTVSLLHLKSCSDLEYNWLGTDDQARDVAARLIYGYRFSLLVGLGAALIWLTVGAVVRAAQGRRLRDALSSSALALPKVFTVSISLLIVLDFLGSGVPPGWPSIGELLRQGVGNLQASWLLISGVLAIGLLEVFSYVAGRALIAFLRRAQPSK